MFELSYVDLGLFAGWVFGLAVSLCGRGRAAQLGIAASSACALVFLAIGKH